MRGHEAITVLSPAACGTLISLHWFLLSVCEFGLTPVVVLEPWLGSTWMDG